MKYPMIALLAFGTVVTAGSAAHAAGVLPDIDPGVVQHMIQSPPANSEHSAVVPIDPPGGGDGGQPAGPITIKKTRNLPTPGNPGGGDSSDDDLPFGDNVKQNRDYALACKITETGALRLGNVGGETMPAGVKIKWKAGSQRGAFRLNIDLEPGASAAAPDMFEDDSVNSCWAAVI